MVSKNVNNHTETADRTGVLPSGIDWARARLILSVPSGWGTVQPTQEGTMILGRQEMGLFAVRALLFTFVATGIGCGGVESEVDPTLATIQQGVDRGARFGALLQ